MKKRIISIATVLTIALSMVGSVYAASSCEVSFQEGSLVVTGSADFGTLDYATKVTITAYDPDNRLNYIEILPIGTDGKVNFSYYNLGKSGNYTFNFDVSAFDKTLTTSLENFIGNDYWLIFCTDVNNYVKEGKKAELAAKILNETGLQLSLEEYNALTNKDDVFLVMIEDFSQDYISQIEIKNAFYNAVALVKLKQDKDVNAYYNASINILGLPVGTKEGSKTVLDDVSNKARNAVLSAISTSCENFMGNADASNKFINHTLYTVIANAEHYSDVKYVLDAYAKADLIDVQTNMNSDVYKKLMNQSFSTETDIVNAIEKALEKPSGGGSSGGTGGSSGGTGGSSGGTGGSYKGTSGMGVAGGSSNTPATPIEVKPTAPQSGKMVFTDMEDAKWALEQVEVLYKKGIISGVGDAKFDPHRYVTREEFSKMLVTLGNYPIETGNVPFGDVKADSWSYPYICTAYKSGIIKGISDDMFGTSSHITREQAVTMIYRMIESNLSEKKNFQFSDDYLISDWAKEAVYRLYANGVVSGRTAEIFSPSEQLTRAEAAVLIYNAGDKILWK